MKLFNVGATRPAADTAWASAANALVHRTLAQHGLATPLEQGEQTDRTNQSSLEEMSVTFSSRTRQPRVQEIGIPSGATFADATYACGAGSRRYRLYVPASASEGATGVVMMLHGCTQTPEDFAAGTGMNALADRHGFVVIYPAQSRGDNAQSCWNWFSRSDQRRGRGEPAILAGLAEKVRAEYDVTTNNTCVAGLSAGAAMAVILGETYPDVFAAVGAHSGLPAGSAKDVPSAFAAMAGDALVGPVPETASHRVRTILFHGSADRTVHPLNGEGIARRARGVGSTQSIETSDTGVASGRSYTREISSDVDGTVLVEHWTVEGQGHAWSGGQPGGSYTDPKGPDASAEMIRFFFEDTRKDS